MKDLVGHATEKIMQERTAALDQEFFMLLQKHSITSSTNIDEIRAALKLNGFEVVRDIKRLDGAQIHTIKLCRIVDEVSIKLLDPTIDVLVDSGDDILFDFSPSEEILKGLIKINL